MTREEKIKEIEQIIGRWGVTDCTTLGIDPVTMPRERAWTKDSTQRIETFQINDVGVGIYVNDVSLRMYFRPYNHLSDELINEIHIIILNYHISKVKEPQLNFEWSEPTFEDILDEMSGLVDDGNNLEYTRGQLELVASFVNIIHEDGDFDHMGTAMELAKKIGLSNEIISKIY